MGTRTLGSSTPPPDNTHNAGTSTNAQWRSNTTVTTTEDSYVDSVRVYCGALSGGSSTFKGCLWNTNNSLRGSGSAITYGTGFGFNIFPFPSNGLLFVPSGTALFGGFQASSQGSQLGLLHNAGHYWLQQSINSPTTFGGSEDTFGQFGDMAWYLTYFPTATVTSIPTSPVAPGSTFTVNGQSFNAGVTSVSVGGVTCSGVTVVNDTTLTAVAPSQGVTGQVQVVTNAGTATSSGSMTVGQIWYGTGSAVASIKAVSFGDPSGNGVVHPVLGIWVPVNPDGSGGVKRIW